MGISIGLLELKSIPPGIETADEMLKAANVALLLCTPICPGKYVIVISGQVGAVRNAVKAGMQKAGVFLVGHHILDNVHESIPGAVTGTTEVEKVRAIGVIETISALASIRAGDIAAKAANITLMEIRIARGLGGKGFLLFTGEVSAVKSALDACISGLEDTGEIISTSQIASPHPDLIEHLL